MLEIEEIYAAIFADTKVKRFDKEIRQTIYRPPFVKLKAIWANYFKQKCDWLEFRKFFVANNSRYEVVFAFQEDDSLIAIKRLKEEYPILMIGGEE